MSDYTPKKKKNDSQYQRFSLSTFLGLSIILHIATFMVAGFTSMSLVSVLSLTEPTFGVLAYGIPQLLVIGMQGWLLNYQFKWSGSRWLTASLIGWIGLLAVTLLLAISVSTMTVTSASILGLLVSLGGTFFVSGMQTLVLREYVQRAWLWIIATFGGLFLGGIANTAIVSMVNANAEIWSPTMIQAMHRGTRGLITGIIFALTLTLLVNLTARDKRKRVVEDDIAQEEIAEARNHLAMEESIQVAEHVQDETLKHRQASS